MKRVGVQPFLIVKEYVSVVTDVPASVVLRPQRAPRTRESLASEPLQSDAGENSHLFPEEANCCRAICGQ